MTDDSGQGSRTPTAPVLSGRDRLARPKAGIWTLNVKPMPACQRVSKVGKEQFLPEDTLLDGWGNRQWNEDIHA
jgi:hypothetical protein